MRLPFIVRQYAGIAFALAAFAGFAWCTALARRFDVDPTRVVHVSVALAVVGLACHELRPYKRQAGLTFDRAHAAAAWKAREAERAAATTKKHA